MLRKICGPKREELAGGWRRLLNEELHNLYVPPNIISLIKSRRMVWAEQVERMVEVRNAYETPVGKPARNITWKT
jgi:hypothetical protein